MPQRIALTLLAVTLGTLPALAQTNPGDPEYGAYLASGCLSCHLRDDSDQGIPAITGWPVQDFVLAMQEFRQKQRPDPTMQVMAARLTDQDIAALAAFFASLTPADEAPE